MEHAATIFIEGLTVTCVIGAYEWERSVRQELRVDLQLRVDTTAAAASDNLDDAPADYALVAQRVQDIAQSTSAKLVEHLAERIADALLAEFPISNLDLTLTKPTAIAAAAGVGIRISR